MSPKNNSLAPIVLFVYNRPNHTRQTLEALSANILADRSVLYIYADGLKPNAKQETIRDIELTRDILYQKDWCSEVHVIEAEYNKGLAVSIVEGVSDVIAKYEKIIVLEDDIVTSPGFLQYMNDALNFYKDQEEVMHISGYMFPVNETLPSTFFYNTASCWGWATWQRAWKYFNTDARMLAEEISSRGKIRAFDIEGTYPFFYKTLVENSEGIINTWAVKWYATLFLRSGHALHPYPSLVNNIGNDGSGENSAKTDRFSWSTLAERIEVYSIPIKESTKARRAMRKYYRKHFRKRKSSKITTLMSALLPYKVKHLLKKTVNTDYREQYRERQRLINFPRYTDTSAILLEKNIRIPDAASFLFMEREIFKQEIYKFRADTEAPLILDCGANIGLSIIYFKKLFPEAKIIGFEPDDDIFGILEHNLKVFELSNITLEKRAVWSSETTLKFYSEGADAGRVIEGQHDTMQKEVKTARLKTYLNEPVDFLKIDIEGAETEVIKDCKDQLHLVKNMFIEYHSFSGKPQSLDEILDTLKGCGFRYYINSPGLHSEQPFISVKEDLGMDMQLNIYCLR